MSSVAPLPIVVDEPPAIDVAGLQSALAALQGEVRWDRLSRALYSTDASVYQIVPLGVVVPKTEADIVATVQACGRFRVPLTARGGGTSQAGQAIGPGLVLDCSKHFNRVLEINAAERWVRVQPGCVLDDLNLALKPHGLQFAPDVSTSNRATIGGMIANNSSGAHSLIYGKTVDHVQELRVVLADGGIVHLLPLDAAAWDKKCAEQCLEGAGYRMARRLAAEHAEEIERRYPKILRRVGGYNLDLYTQSGRAGGVSHPREHSANERSPRGADAPRSPELNLAHLFVGSEGTLGVTLEARLNLVELPRAKALVVVHFADLLEALGATPLILTHRPSAVEVVDRYVLDSTKLNPDASRLRGFLQGDPGAVLIVEFYGDAAADLPPRVEALIAALRDKGLGYHCHRATESAAQADIWKLRKMALGLSMAQKGDAKALSFVEDTAVSPDRLRDYIAEFLQVVARHGTRAGVYAHASVGCLHVRPVIDLKTAEGVHRFQAIADDVADLVLKYGGALSGEHGDGLVRSPYQEKMFGPVLYQAFRELKRTLDPLNILNPGKVVDAPPLTSNLRFGPAYVTPTVPTTFDFTADGGIVQAAELCAGVGACRKQRDGNMCPSYRATCEEQHSTRGRANALRLALTGQLGFDGLTDPALHEALDLCLECKACKSECPTNVDMARLKAEFLDQYYKKHGLPWRNWIFGNVARLSSWGLPWSRTINRLARSKLVRLLNEKLFAIDQRRLPPALAEARLARRWLTEEWLESPMALRRQEWVRCEREESLLPKQQPRVLLFPDTFTMLYEPGIGQAAVRLLRRMKCQVVVGMPDWFARNRLVADIWPNGLRCCGRPFISNGMLDQAVELARHNVETLFAWTRGGQTLVACEPSCILTIKDDYPALLKGEELRFKAQRVADACQTLEELVESDWEDSRTGASHGKLGGTFRAGPRKILVQAHCHQRSLVGVRPLLSLLRRIPGAEVVDLDAGCCGMAGSFGYETEHYEISRLVGEQRLFPAIRNAAPETVIVAPGFSCRMQIKHFTGRTALHPAELLFSLLGEPGGR